MKCAVLTQKCGDDSCTVGANIASISADRILVKSLKLKDRDGIRKLDDRKSGRMAMIGMCSKGIYGQTYTSSSNKTHLIKRLEEYQILYWSNA